MNRDRDFLVDIIELIETIQRNLPDTEKEFLEDEVLLTATIHWVQTIGEAANAVSEVLRTQHPQVPWREIVDMRNLLAHESLYETRGGSLSALSTVAGVADSAARYTSSRASVRAASRTSA